MTLVSEEDEEDEEEEEEEEDVEDEEDDDEVDNNYPGNDYSNDYSNDPIQSRGLKNEASGSLLEKFSKFKPTRTKDGGRKFYSHKDN